MTASPAIDCAADQGTTRPVSLEDEQQLMSAVRAGDREALARVYDRTASAVYGLALHVLRRSDDAEAVVSDVFYELWRRPERFDSARGSLRSYLLTMTRCRAIDRARASARRTDKTAAARDAAEGDLRIRQQERTPEHDAIAHERRRLVRDALANLNPAERETLELAYFQGMTHSQIAASLKQPLGTVKTRLRRAVIALRAAFPSESEGGP